MIVRIAHVAGLCAAVACCLVTAVSAIEVAPDLTAALAEKSGSGPVPVLLLFDDPPQPKSLPADLAALDPAQRRRAVVDALRRDAALVGASVRATLEKARSEGEVSRIRYLYLAGAISFAADAAGVEELAALPAAATMHHDPPRLLTGAAQRGATDKSEPAPGDIAWGVDYIGAPRVWNELGLTGDGILVGHIDTGVLLTHTDLVDRLWVNPGEVPGNGLDDDGNGFIDDVHGYDFGDGDGDPGDDARGGGHGTHTAGTIAGDGTGGLVTGVAPGAKLIIGKVYRADGSGGTLGDIWAAQQYCVENGARIMNMSLARGGEIPVTFLRSDRYNYENIRNAGVICFNAAGNDFTVYEPPLEIGMSARPPAPWQPGHIPHSHTGGVVSVGGTAYKSDLRYTFSSRGPAHWDHVDPWHDWSLDPGTGLIKPDIAMPGANVNSTVRTGGYSGETWSGTSMACPHAAGLAALMLEKNPSLSPAGIDSLMELNAVDLGVPGKDNEFGSGLARAFDIVSAVPEAHLPNLAWTEVWPDPEGAAHFEPGSETALAVQVKNISSIANATGVQVYLAVPPNPYVTVIKEDAVIADLAPGMRGDNLNDMFRLDVSSDTPQGYEFTMLVTVTAAGGFTRTYDRKWYVGLPEWRTHDAGAVYLTVTDQGIVGYMGMDQQFGRGMGPRGEASDLFLGSFWAGTGPDYVCNRDYEGLGAENYEWQVSRDEPNGRVHVLDKSGAGQLYRSAFTDAGHNQPRDLLVEQMSLAAGEAPDDSYVILEYRLTNRGETDLSNLHTGLYCDFDIGSDTGADVAATDLDLDLAYQYGDDGLYYGIALLGETPAANVSAVDNLKFVYARSHVTDQDKYDLLTGAAGDIVGGTPSDWSILVSAAVDLAAEGGTAKVAYALILAGSLDELQENAAAAKAAYAEGAVDPDPDPLPVYSWRLAQNHPNPFNPGTRISFSLDRAGPVELVIYDLRGRPVRTLVRGERGEGDHLEFWDGTDAQGARVPSGLYLYRLTAAGRQETRKMMLLK